MFKSGGIFGKKKAPKGAASFKEGYSLGKTVSTANLEKYLYVPFLTN